MQTSFITALVLARLHLVSVEPTVDRIVDVHLVQKEIATSALPWPSRSTPLRALGRGVALVFSPDLAAPQNRAFYEGLGFTYIETADWTEALEQLADASRSQQISTLVIESHGANGNGLKLQTGTLLLQGRSYASLGAVQERVAPLGIQIVMLSACNAGRLYRPQIYNALDRRNPDPLFLPPTLGVLDASAQFSRAESRVRVIRRQQSELETMMEVRAQELPAAVRAALPTPLFDDGRLTISTMLMQAAVRDAGLVFTSQGFVAEKSRDELSEPEREALLRRFLIALLARAI